MALTDMKTENETSNTSDGHGPGQMVRQQEAKVDLFR